MGDTARVLHQAGASETREAEKLYGAGRVIKIEKAMAQGILKETNSAAIQCVNGFLLGNNGTEPHYRIRRVQYKRDQVSSEDMRLLLSERTQLHLYQLERI